jgi:hypothetical protein
VYWSVFDRAALEFSQALYGGLLAGRPIGEAVHGARAAIKPTGDPTWLAYVAFADALAVAE